ncbi:hypothetical protein HMPREF1544_00178 [Mucor circinelloides 1006PhL]|uniref:Mid2 domain-containing protein n=1 Tax=Mucor circinelloides f. circinelloides (strain 1006PhL) TaxID=1220926 RepID=S2JT03_MUCC1|nr:hypothetical protein HMPREF1544_00178 [Mucor circinelloides 1006PhL]
MRPSLKKSILFALVVLQCTSVVYSQQQQQQDQASGNVVSGQQQTQQQQQQPESSSEAPAATSVPAATTTTPPPAVTTTTEAPQSSSTQAPDTKTDATVAPTSTTTTAAPTSDAVVPSSSSEARNTSSQTRKTPQASTTMVTSNGSLVPSVITPSDSAKPTESGAANKKDDGESGSNNTAIIAGSVVGGLVGIALIAGLLTWMNRRGGCTSRTRRRDVQEDFTNENDYKMTENTVAAGGAGAVHSTDNLPPPSPFQHARRFVPPTSNPTGYMNLQDEEYGYHQNANVGAGYQPQQYQDYNAGCVYHDGSHPDYNQDYQQQEYYNSHEYAAHDYSADGSVTGSNHGGYQQQAYYGHAPGSNVTSPTLTNTAPLHQMKPDQVEQKPNVA